MRALLLDDDIKERARVRRALAKAHPDLEVVEVKDRKSFEQALEGGQFDLVLTEARVRWTTGLEVLKASKARYPRLPVIMHTASGSQELAVEGMKRGLSDFLPKSKGHLSRLAASVKQVLEQARIGSKGLFEDVPIGLFRLGPSGRFLEANRTLAQLVGYPEGLGEVTFQGLHVEPGEARRLMESLERDGSVRGFTSHLKRKDGGTLWIETMARAVLGPSGAILYIEGCVQEVTERRRSDEHLRMLEEAFDSLPIGVTITDLDGLIRYTNRAEATSHGYTVPELLGQEARSLVTQVAPQPLTLEGARQIKPWKRERVNVRKDGTTFTAQLFSDLLVAPDGKPIGILTTSADITTQKQIEEQLKRSAFFDPLTHLPNRALFLDRLGRALERARRRSDYVFAVLFFDLDGFKAVNDTFGHLVGDGVLVETARKLEACIRPSDTISRLGGDEFAILVEDIKDLAGAVAIADRSQKALMETIDVGGQAILSTGSIGIALGGPNYETPEDLLRDADVAMYKAKTLGKARHEIFDRKRDAGNLRRLGPDLKRAVSKGELRLVYQPIVSLRNGEVVGAEALLRWEHPERGLLLPRVFLPIAEETGLIVPIGEWVIGAAIAQGKEWHAQGHPIFVSVNLSPRECQALSDRFGDLARSSEFLVFETPPDALRDLPRGTLKGLRIAIEDSGSFPLGGLRELPVKFLKLDASMYQGGSLDPRAAAALKERITSAQILGFEVVAKGVEKGEELSLVRDQGCDLAQGRFLGEPAIGLRWP